MLRFVVSSVAMPLHAVNPEMTVHGDITPARNLEVQVALLRGRSVQCIRCCGTLGKMHTAEVENSGPGSAVSELDQVDVRGLAVVEPGAAAPQTGEAR